MNYKCKCGLKDNDGLDLDKSQLSICTFNSLMLSENVFPQITLRSGVNPEHDHCVVWSLMSQDELYFCGLLTLFHTQICFKISSTHEKS